MKPAAAWWDAMWLLHGMRDGHMTRKKDPELEALFGALCVAVGCDPEMPRSQATIYWICARELKDFHATPEQVQTVARGIRASGWGKGNDSAVTPKSIVNHWTEFVGGTAADKRIAIDRKKRDATDRLKKKQVRAALALSPSDFDEARNRLLEIDHGLMRKYLLEEPARENLYLLERIGQLLDKGKP